MTIKQAKEQAKLVTPLTWDKWTNQRIQKLHPLIRYAYACAINECKDELGIKVRLTTGERSNAEQDELYGHSRTAEELIEAGVDPNYAKPNESWKTNAKAGESYHQYGLAGDNCIITKDGKADFTITPEIAGIFKKYGFTWMYDRIGKDKPHFDITFGYHWSQLQNMVTSGGYIVF